MGSFWIGYVAARLFDLAQGLVLGAAERWWPAVRTRRRAGVGVDVAYLLTYPLLAALLPFAALAPTAEALRPQVPLLVSTQAALGALPTAVEIALAVLVADLAGYWKHRLFHTRLLWPVHAIHHSSEEVDWLSNERVHPVEAVATTLFHLVPLLTLGFSASAVTAAAALRRAHSLYEHGNLAIGYGRAAWLFVSPELHRWHHAADPRVHDRNYANVFAFWDVLFGSFWRPTAPAPARLGLPEVPRTFGGQLLWPFRRSPTA